MHATHACAVDEHKIEWTASVASAATTMFASCPCTSGPTDDHARQLPGCHATHTHARSQKKTFDKETAKKKTSIDKEYAAVSTANATTSALTIARVRESHESAGMEWQAFNPILPF